MRLTYVIFTLAMLASVSTAQAIPNMWTSGFGMGVVTNGAIVIHTQRLKSDPGGNLLS